MSASTHTVLTIERHVVEMTIGTAPEASATNPMLVAPARVVTGGLIGAVGAVAGAYVLAGTSPSVFIAALSVMVPGIATLGAMVAIISGLRDLPVGS